MDVNIPEMRESGGDTALVYAVFFNSIECVNILLKNGADPKKAGGGHSAYKIAELSNH